MRRAYSLIELIVIVLFVAAFAAIAVPRINFAIISKKNAETVSRKIVTDLRRVRNLAISDAAGNSNGYALRMIGAAPYRNYQIVNLKSAQVIDSHQVPDGITCNGGSEFKFGPGGNLTGSDTQLAVSAGGKSLTISIVAATGMVKCSDSTRSVISPKLIRSSPSRPAAEVSP